MMGVRFFALAAAVSAVSCGSNRTGDGLASPVSSVRLAAIDQAARESDREAIPQLVEMLNADDIAVRFAAIGALQRLTGQTYGYAADDPAPQRRHAIAEWVSAVESGALEIRPVHAAPPPPSNSGAVDA
jgi:HEAT repeat protein